MGNLPEIKSILSYLILYILCTIQKILCKIFFFFIAGVFSLHPHFLGPFLDLFNFQYYCKCNALNNNTIHNLVQFTNSVSLCSIEDNIYYNRTVQITLTCLRCLE